MKLNDYAAMHGMLPTGDYVRSTEDVSEGSHMMVGASALSGSKDYGNYKSSTASAERRTRT